MGGEGIGTWEGVGGRGWKRRSRWEGSGVMYVSNKVCVYSLKVSASGRVMTPPLIQTHPAEVVPALCM